MADTWVAKDPDETKDYSFDWSGTFVYDYITASTWALQSGTGLTLSTGTFTDNKTTVRVSGGTLNVAYVICNTITTSKGQILQRTANLTITAK